MSNPLSEALDNPIEAPDFGPIGSNSGGQGPDPLDEEDYERFPPGCPVKVLGNQQDVSGKQTCYYLNYNGQLVGLEAGNRHGKLGLAALFGPKLPWLEAHYPQWSKPRMEYNTASKKWEQVEKPRVVGFDQSKAAQALVIECTRQGIFSPAGRLRGRGAHKPAKGVGGLVLHLGDTLLTTVPKVKGGIKEWVYIEPGLHERFVYQAGEPLPRPWHDDVSEKPAETVLRLIKTWAWKRPLLDPVLLLGMIGASMLGGALDWRPHVWITGGRGCGKSTLNGQEGMISKLFGEGLYRTADTTAAGIRSHLLNATIPVMIDEQEAEADDRNVQNIIKLARIASSGDKASRGSSDHGGVEFTLQSCFWFSSILIPALEAQDRSRLAILSLDPLPEGVPPPPELKTLDFGLIGRQLLRRMQDGWPRLAETKMRFHELLAEMGHDNRACDQFGTLLACADVLISKNVEAVPSEEDMMHWVADCRPQRMAEVTETTPDHEACVNHILTTQQQARGGDEREQIGTWLGKALNWATFKEPMNDDEFKAQSKANDRLHQIGLKLVNVARLPSEEKAGKTIPARWGARVFKPDAPGFLAVAVSHQGLGRVFESTRWKNGVWKQSLARVPGAIDEGVQTKFGHVKGRVVLVPLNQVFDEEDLPALCLPDQANEWVAKQLQEHP